MGYRANVITQHREYGDQSFGDWELFEDLWGDFTDFVEINVPEAWTSRSENLDYFEASKDGIKEYIEHIRVMPPEEKHSHYTDYTNKELIETLKRAIEQAPDYYVSWEWF